MELAGVLDEGRIAFRRQLPHGAFPEVVAHEAGYAIEHPLDATLVDGELLVRFAVRRLPAGARRPALAPRGTDHNLDLTGVRPVVRQRVAAYAVVTSARGLLATEYSERTAVAGRWGMPGGGLDDQEDPVAAVLREVVEETSQRIVLGGLGAVQSSHWVGRSPRGVIEDFHAVRLVYRATCDSPDDPVVLDVDGTTRSARWVPLQQWRDVHWTSGWSSLLGQFLD